MKYSKEQQKAINTIDGQVCIISVAGSGKTSVIVARANNIIKSGVRPYIFQGCGSADGRQV